MFGDDGVDIDHSGYRIDRIYKCYDIIILYYIQCTNGECNASTCSQVPIYDLHGHIGHTALV